MATSAQDAAREILEFVPTAMRTIRMEMRAHTAGLSIPQFRALGFVERNAAPSLSDVAEHIGLTLPTMSKLMDGLVARKLVLRASHATDRRRVTLALTPRGRKLLQAAHVSTEAALAARLATLGETERASVVRTLHLLQPFFARGKNAPCPGQQPEPRSKP